MHESTGNEMTKKAKILIVDDDATFVDQAASALREEKHSVQSVKNAEEAMKKMNKSVFDIIITDIILPGTDGLKLLELIKEHSPSTDVIFCTSYSGVESAVKALKAGAYDYLIKPIETDTINYTVRRCLDQRSIYEENAELKDTMELIAACKNISTTFDLDKISKFALDVMLKETKASTGLFLAYTPEDGKTLQLLDVKGTNSSQAKKLGDIFLEMPKKWAKSKKKKSESIFKLTAKEIALIQTEYKSLKDGVVVAVKVKTDVKAYIILLNSTKAGDFSDDNLKNLDFILKETSLAFSNLDQLLGAKELAYIDDLTELYNSRYLYLILDREIKRAKRFKTTLVLLFIDLDQFKKVNDSHGHLAGGKVLSEMAGVLLDCVREIDTVVRYGGDEYVIVLTEANLKSGRMVAERIRSSIEKHVFLKDEGLDINLTACIGIAAFPKHALTRKELIHFADMAMYMGKETTKNAVYIAAERLQP